MTPPTSSRLLSLWSGLTAREPSSGGRVTKGNSLVKAAAKIGLFVGVDNHG